MSITITDPMLLSQLEDTNDFVELKAPDGRIIGTFATEGLGKLPPGIKSPFTPEEIAELRKQRTSRPLKDILTDLRERLGE